MNIVITAGEILDKGDWDRFCALKGITPWAINEGLMADDEKFELTMEEDKEIGII